MTGIFLVFEMQIGMNEFDHAKMSLCKHGKSSLLLKTNTVTG